MSYQAATGTFSYRWQLRTRGSGKVGICIQLSYRSVETSQWRFITIRR